MVSGHHWLSWFGASMNNDLLNIDLVREIPEVMKPRHINIADGSAAPRADVLGNPSQTQGDTATAAPQNV